jgi:hypothetical protein
MKTYLPGQEVWVRGVGHLAWLPAKYVTAFTPFGKTTSWHKVEMQLSGIVRSVPSGRIKGACCDPR